MSVCDWSGWTPHNPCEEPTMAAVFLAANIWVWGVCFGAWLFWRYGEPRNPQEAKE